MADRSAKPQDYLQKEFYEKVFRNNCINNLYFNLGLCPKRTAAKQ